MRDRLHQLVLRQAVVAGAGEMRAQLLGPVHRNQRRHRDQTAVALRQPGTRPDIAEKNLVRQLGELGRNVAEQLLCVRNRFHSEASVYCSSLTFTIQSTTLLFRSSWMAVWVIGVWCAPYLGCYRY